MPTIRKIRAVAKPGNQPECMAEMPTISSEAKAAKAAKSTQMMNMGMLISVSRPQTIAKTMATTA